MLIRMLVGLCGPTLTLGPGDEHEFPDAEAVRIVESGYAVPVAEKRVERAVTAQPQETRTKPRPKQRKTT